jgi:uncharacterized protein (UPF0548 family)
MSETVVISVISAVAAVVTTYLTVRYKNRVIKKTEKPKDRMETIFDGYEKLIRQQQVEIDRKGVAIGSLESIILRLEEELTKTKQLLEVAKGDLLQSREQNTLLTRQLEAMKIEYTESK